MPKCYTKIMHTIKMCPGFCRNNISANNFTLKNDGNRFYGAARANEGSRTFFLPHASLVVFAVALWVASGSRMWLCGCVCVCVCVCVWMCDAHSWQMSSLLFAVGGCKQGKLHFSQTTSRFCFFLCAGELLSRASTHQRQVSVLWSKLSSSAVVSLCYDCK